MDSDEQIKTKKKKHSKKAQLVPMDNLGFKIKMHADTIDPRNIKKKNIHHKKSYKAKSTKENFMARLRMVIDVNDLPLDTQSHLFRVTKKNEWAFVKKVFYRSREKVFCYICLEQNIIAPQITFCGHIYCFHCILMHFKKSSNCYACPVCKQIVEKQELKTCQIKYEQQVSINDEITLNLKYRQGHYLYNADTLVEDINCMQMIRMRTKGIKPIFQSELDQIKAEISITNEKERNYDFLVEAMTIATQKITHLQKYLNLPRPNLRSNQILQNETIFRRITAEQAKRLNTFYQQKSGSLIFIHKLCKKYMNLTKQNQPIKIESVVLQKQEVDFNEDEDEYKEISLFNAGLEVDAVIINITNYATPENLEKFKIKFEYFIKERERQQKEQEIQLERLRIQYEEQQQYINKLKQQQQSQFYFDVKLPPTLDPSDINEHSFPSLISVKSDISGKQNQKQIEQAATTITRNMSEAPKKQKKFDLTRQIDSFPDISQMQPTRSQGTKGVKVSKKKKKGKFIDVTHEILFNREQDQYD